MSIEEHALRRRFIAQDDSQDTSNGSDPRRSRDVEITSKHVQ